MLDIKFIADNTEWVKKSLGRKGFPAEKVDELLEAYNMGELTKEELDGIYATKDRLIEEIKNGTNPCMQIDYLRYLDNM